MPRGILPPTSMAPTSMAPTSMAPRPAAPDCEFGLELIAVLPALHAKLVDRTVSLRGTSPFYHWSPAHSEVEGSRKFTMLVPPAEWPICSLHTCSRLPPPSEVWNPPPMVTPARVARGRALWGAHGGQAMPVVVHNKICDEWGTGPIHRIPDEHLAALADTIASSGRRMLYVRPTGAEPGFSRDENLIDPAATSDFRTVETHGGVTLQAIMAREGVDYNEAQVMLSCIAEDFVSVQGGASIVASYFGGTNFVYARKGVELARRLYEADSLIPALSGAKITTTDTAQQLPDLLHRHLARKSSGQRHLPDPQKP